MTILLSMGTDIYNASNQQVLISLVFFFHRYFQEVLASNKLSSEDNEIQLHKDGSWSTHVKSNDSCTLDTPSKPVQKVEVVSDDIGKCLAYNLTVTQ